MKAKKTRDPETTAKTVLGKGVDSLYLYLDVGMRFKRLFEIGDALAFDEDVRIGEMNFQRTKAWMRTYPVSLKHGPFTFYLNRVSMFIQVGSLGFEMRGFKGCLAWLFSIMDQLNGARLPWIEHLMVSRIDVFTDFIFDDDFNPQQFQTRLRRKGTFISGENEEGRTYYFGSRSIFCVRLYVKSVEINKAGKQYLRAEWKNNGYTDQRVWRLEFEFRKQKLERLMGRELIKFDEKALTSLWSFGINELKYKERTATHNNMSKLKLHPVWQELHDALFQEYSIQPIKARQANLEFRYKMARKMLLSYYAAKAEHYNNIPEANRQEFNITEYDYQKARRKSVLHGIETGA